MTARPIETPVYIPCGDEHLFGVLTEPAAAANGLTALQLWGAGPYPSSGRNRVRVDLAHRLARHGFRTLRIDYHGVAESSGPPTEIRLDRPFTEDGRAASAWLAERGHRSIVLVGSCFGARTALTTAEHVPGLQGAVLIGPQVRDEDHVQQAARRKPLSWYVRRAIRPSTIAGLLDPGRRHTYARWGRAKVARVVSRSTAHRPEADPTASRSFLRTFGGLVTRQVPVLFVYGDRDVSYEEFVAAQADGLGRLLDQAGDRVTVRTLAGAPTALATVALQDELNGAIEDWCAGLATGAGGGSRTPTGRPTGS